MTYNEFVAMFAGRKGTTFAGLDVVTIPKLNKKNRVTGESCPFSDVRKHATINVMLGADYERRVQKVTGDDSFAAGVHQWSDEHDGYLQRKGESYYLQVMIRDSVSYYTGNVDGVERAIEHDELVDYLPKPSDNPTGIATYSLDSIRTIRVDRQSHSVESAQPATIPA